MNECFAKEEKKSLEIIYIYFDMAVFVKTVLFLCCLIIIDRGD